MAKDRPPIKPASRAEFVAAMKKFADDANAELEMIEREQARLMLRDAMTFSPPMPKGGGQGLSKAAWKAGKGRLAKDVRRIFIPMDEAKRGRPVFLRQVISSLRSGKWYSDLMHLQQMEPNIKSMSPVLRKIIQDQDPRRSEQKAKNYLSKARADGSFRLIEGPTNDLRGIHDKYKGKVGGRWPKNAPVGGPQYMVNSSDALNAYIAERQLKVGYVKAGYADALARVPMPTTKSGLERNYGAYDAPWVDANNAGYGTYAVTKLRGKVMAVIGNNIGNVNGVADESDVKNIVYGNRVANLEVALQRRRDQLVERANKRRK
jgi:hypothetical protein